MKARSWMALRLALEVDPAHVLGVVMVSRETGQFTATTAARNVLGAFPTMDAATYALLNAR